MAEYINLLDYNGATDALDIDGNPIAKPIPVGTIINSSNNDIPQLNTDAGAPVDTWQRLAYSNAAAAPDRVTLYGILQKGGTRAGRHLQLHGQATCSVEYEAPAVAIAAGVAPLDFSLHEAADLTLTENVTSLPITDSPDERAELAVRITQDGTGGRTVAGWDGKIVWLDGGVAPTIPSAANEGCLIALSKFYGTYYGRKLGDF